MSQRALIESQIDAAYNQMNKEYPHAALPNIDARLEANVPHLPRTENGMHMKRLSDKYEENADLQLLAAHSMLRLEKTQLVKTMMDQGLLETMVNLAAADENMLSEGLRREVEQYEQKIEQMRVKLDQENHSRNATEEFLHEKLREKIKEVLLQ